MGLEIRMGVATAVDTVIGCLIVFEEVGVLGAGVACTIVFEGVDVIEAGAASLIVFEAVDVGRKTRIGFGADCPTKDVGKLLVVLSFGKTAAKTFIIF
jgi:hypothetical protein